MVLDSQGPHIEIFQILFFLWLLEGPNLSLVRPRTTQVDVQVGAAEELGGPSGAHCFGAL